MRCQRCQLKKKKEPPRGLMTKDVDFGRAVIPSLAMRMISGWGTAVGLIMSKDVAGARRGWSGSNDVLH